MKFAKELEDDLVPEWRLKYLDYKQGKKKIKAVARALRVVNQTPKFGSRTRLPGASTPTSGRVPFTSYDFTKKRTPAADTEPLRNAAPPGQSARPDTERSDKSNENRPIDAPSTSNASNGLAEEPSSATSRPTGLRQLSATIFTRSPPIRIPEMKPLTPDNGSTPFRMTRYGSIIGTPPKEDTLERGIPSLELPGPAVRADQDSQVPFQQWDFAGPHQGLAGQNHTNSPDAYHVGATHVPHKKGFSLPRDLFKSKRTISHPHTKSQTARAATKRLLTATPIESPGSMDINLNAYRDLDARQDEFFAFLDKELEKVESFYQLKENEATHRLQVLRDQLHEMRDRRMAEITAAKDKGKENQDGVIGGLLHGDDKKPNGDGGHVSFLKPIEEAVKRKPRVGATSKAMGKLASPSAPHPAEDQKDYVRRSVANEHVPYKAAKRKLKLALQEFYRGLELLKSYAMLNRTAFRKINKKYDKAVNARPILRYMTEKVNKAHFVQSDIIEGHIVAVEDLYSRYFEKGNRKVAVSKLRSSWKRHGDFTQSSFRNGLFVAGGLVFGIQGLVDSVGHLHSNDALHAVRTSYLLQLYAGYFLSLLLFILFTLACRVWTGAKVNYAFVFEYDARHTLDWRQLAELPSFFLLLNGLFIWLNFRSPATDSLFIYWPIILIGVSLIIMAFPAPIFYHNARKWWAFSNWRLLLAGIYPVEFRDFFLGDMYCSETYAMGNIELFFCLYAQDWSRPDQCNSSHSRLLGFFSTLPGIWRALQCLRRYYDSRNWFPHLANFGKYLANILYYMSLSLYRIHKVTQLRALFILFAAINSIYCSFWDVFMDWSLGNPYARHPFLRDNLAYRHIWPYYLAMILDPIIRFQWIFYALYQQDLQHSASLSFVIALAEVLRRGMWVLFRVENEHCNNVGRFRASRDIPLPYKLLESPRESQEALRPPPEQGTPMATGVDLEQSPNTTGPTLRMRKTKSTEPPTPVVGVMKRVGTVIITAHSQDYEKKRRPGIVVNSPESGSVLKLRDSSEDEEEEEDESLSEGQDLMEVHKVLKRDQGDEP